MLISYFSQSKHLHKTYVRKQARLNKKKPNFTKKKKIIKFSVLRIYTVCMYASALYHYLENISKLFK